MTAIIKNSDALDTLVGAAAIGAYIGLNVRQAYRALETGDLPATKIAGKWITTRERLRRRVAGENLSGHARS